MDQKKEQEEKEAIDQPTMDEQQTKQQDPGNEETAEEQSETKSDTGEEPVAEASSESSESDPLKELENQLEKEKDKYLRLAAEFDNYRKRTLKEKAELILNGGEKSINSILPVVDDLERALKNMETAEDVNAVKTGVELIYNKFMKVLEQNGVKVIDTQNNALNTDFHEAIAVIPAPKEEQKGKIIDCVQTGYTLNGKVLRHAKVVVGE